MKFHFGFSSICTLRGGLPMHTFFKINTVHKNITILSTTIGYMLRFISPVFVYTGSGFVLLIPVLYIRLQMKKCDSRIDSRFQNKR